MAQKVRFLQQKVVSADGYNARVYESGSEHEVGSKEMPEELAEVLLRDGIVEEVHPKSIHVSVTPAQEEDKPKDAPKVGRPRLPGPSEIKGK